MFKFWCLRLQNWYFKHQFWCLKHQNLFMKLKIGFWCLEHQFRCLEHQNWCSNHPKLVLSVLWNWPRCRGKRRGLTVIISDCGAGGPRFKSRARNSFFSRNLKCLSSCCIRGCLNHTAIQKHLLYLLLSPGNIRGCLNHIAIKRRWISSGVLRWQLPKNL